MTARQAGLQLGPMVGRLANLYAGRNLSSYLRAACMLEAFYRAGDMHSQSQDSDALGLRDLFHLTPNPGTVVSADATLLDVNSAFSNWLRRDKATLVGNSLGTLLRLQQRQSFSRFWENLKASRSSSSTRMALILLPGRLIASEITFVRISGQSQPESQYFVWFRRAADEKKGAPLTKEGRPISKLRLRPQLARAKLTASS